MDVGLNEAARLTGKYKSTIERAADAGRLSFTRNGPNGPMRFEVCELERVYGLVSKNVSAPTEAETRGPDLADELRRTKLVLEMTERERDQALELARDRGEERDRWQEQARQSSVIVEQLLRALPAPVAAEPLEERGKVKEAEPRRRLFGLLPPKVVVAG